MDTENNKQKAIVLFATSLALGLGYDYLIYGKALGLGFLVYIALVVGALCIISWYFKKEVNNEVLWLILPVTFFSSMVFVRSNELLTALNVLAVISLLLLVIKAYTGASIRSAMVVDHLRVYLLPIWFVRPCVRTLSELSSIVEDRRLLQVGIGLLKALPVLVVFVLLFASADLIFCKHLSYLISLICRVQALRHVMVILGVTCVLTGAFAYGFLHTSEAMSEKMKRVPYISHIESAIILGSVNILFAMFICVQLAYLFGGGGNISSEGFTYSEYARKGFFELIAVAVVSFLMLWRKENDLLVEGTKHPLVFKILGSALIGQVLVIMCSASKRLSLYEEAYGFTSLRFYSHAFIILLVVIFCLMLYRIYMDEDERVISFHMLISVTSFLVVLNLVNPDAFIARRNIDRFVATGQLDWHYLSNLSDDAIPVSIELLYSPDAAIKMGFEGQVRTRMSEPPSDSIWQSMNISRMTALKVWKERKRT